MVAVGASGPGDEWEAYSNYDAEAVQLSAPGNYILSTWPGGLVEWCSGGWVGGWV